MDINLKLKEIIKEVLSDSVDVSTIKEETNLINDLGFDSILIIQLIIELESKFNIQIEDDDMEIDNLTIYGKLYEMIDYKLNLK